MGKQPSLAGHGSGQEIRVLNRSLAGAGDSQLARVVAVVDALPERGPADALIAPFRSRLAAMRPDRPLSFTRLLFHPFEPVIVPAPQWRPGLPTIPRSVLRSFAATVLAGLGAEGPAIEASISGHRMHDLGVIAIAGARLWPQAAEILLRVPRPVGWAETGLNEIVYPPLARRISTVLTEMPVLNDLAAEAESGIAPPRLAPICAMLDRVAARCQDALPNMVALLLARLPLALALLPGIAATAGPRVEPLLQAAGEQAIDALLQRLERGSGTEIPLAADLGEAATEVRRIAALLRTLAPTAAQPERRDRLRTIRQRLDATCRTRFAQSLATEFVAPLRSLVQRPDDAAAARLETAARHLRELETEARAIGSAESYDALLRQAGSLVNSGAAILRLADRVRLVEILCGPEAALAVLSSGETGR